MGVVNGPNFTNNGLVFYIDASNVSSYPGTGSNVFDIATPNSLITSQIAKAGVTGSGVTFSRANLGTFILGENSYIATNYTQSNSVTWTYNHWFYANQVSIARYQTISILNTPTYILNTIGISTNVLQLWPTDQVQINVTSISASQYYNYTVVREGNNITNGYKLYLNGQFVGATNSGNNPNYTTNLWIGSRSDVADQYLNGRVTHMSIYNRALSAAEIASNYNALQSKFQIVTWEPTFLGSTLWLDASDISTITITGASSVSQLRDKSGNGRDFAQATVANQPLLVNTSWTPRRVLSFNILGSTQSLASSANITTMIPSLFQYTTFVVFRATNTQTYGSGGGDLGRIAWGDNAGSYGTTLRQNQVQSYLYTINGAQTTQTTYTDNTSIIATNTFGDGILSIRNMGATGATISSTQIAGAGVVRLAQSWSNLYTAMEFAELLFFPTLISETNIKIVEGYLAWKWNLQTSLPDTHPFRNAAPLSDLSGNVINGTQSRLETWTPAQIATSIWLDASDITTLTLVGASVSQWNDKSGNGRNINQAASSQQPAYNSEQFNGLPTITFDGSNDFLSSSSVGASGLTSVSIISVFKMISGGATEDIPMGIGSTPNTSKVRTFYRTVSGTTVGFGGWSNDVATSSVSYDIGGSPHIFEVWNTQLATPDNVRITRDGATPIGYTSSAGNLLTTVDGFTVGSLQGGLVGTYYTNMAVAEIIVLYSAVSDTNRQLIEGYLAWKWGLQANLPGNHPFKNFAPVFNRF